MIVEPNCFKRGCVYFQGVKWLGKEENTEVCFCLAFPQGIPQEIAHGKDLHLTVRGDEEIPISFKKE